MSSSEARAPVETQNATSARSRCEGSRANRSVNTKSGICRGTRRGTRGRNRPGLLPAERVHRVVVRVRPARSGQRERVHDRPGASLKVIGVETPADRLAVRHRRRRVLHARGPFARHRRRPAPAGRRACPASWDPPAEVAGLGPRRLVPRHSGGPGEPEPAQQRQRVRPLRRRRPPGRLQVPQELRHRLDPSAVRAVRQYGSHGSPVSTSAPDCGDHERPGPGRSSSPSATSRDRNDRGPRPSGE